jgi:ketosteroid isomerase-like protein
MKYMMKFKTLAVLAASGLALAACNQAPDAATQTALDRIAVEDLITDYYENFGGTENEDFAKYYTEDASFDVNGLVYKGHAEIVKLYDELGQEPDAATQGGTFHMLLGNPIVKVDGDQATVKLFWTGVMNDKIDAPPHLVEQGREYDLLVKVDGKWLIKKRVVIADSGLPEMFKATYTPRMDYDVTKEDAPATPASSAPASSAAPSETPAE